MRVVALKPPRGIANNNPLNLRKTGIVWDGEAPGLDPDFETFATAEMGIRAGTKNLLTHYRRGCKSVGALISKHAPPNENDTTKYIATVCKWIGVEPDQPLDLTSRPRGHLQLEALVTAIIRYENGRNPEGKDWYPQHEPDGSPGPIARGVGMALEG
jgi:hypothetical protein